MPSEFSLRQVLACLNISVFDPLVEPALKKACRIDAEQKTAKRDPFHNIVSLVVLQAAAYAKGGEIFVLDMGEPVKIDALARNLISLSGYRPDEDIKIVYTGLRPGEKLYEEKLMAEEGLKRTSNELIHIGMPIPFEEDVFLKQLSRLMQAAYDNRPDIRELVAEVVTTYRFKEETPDSERSSSPEEE